MLSKPDNFNSLFPTETNYFRPDVQGQRKKHHESFSLLECFVIDYNVSKPAVQKASITNRSKNFKPTKS